MITKTFRASCCAAQYTDERDLRNHLRDAHPRGVMRRDSKGQPLVYTCAHAAPRGYDPSKVRMAPTPLTPEERERLGVTVRTPEGAVGQVWSLACPGVAYDGVTPGRGYVWVAFPKCVERRLQTVPTSVLTRFGDEAQPSLPEVAA